MRLTKRVKIILISVLFLFLSCSIGAVLFQLKATHKTTSDTTTKNKSKTPHQSYNFANLFGAQTFKSVLKMNENNQPCINKDRFQYQVMNVILKAYPNLNQLKFSFTYPDNLTAYCIIAYQISSNSKLETKNLKFSWQKNEINIKNKV